MSIGQFHASDERFQFIKRIGTLGINVGGGGKSNSDENSTNYSSNYKYPLINCSSTNNITSPSGPHHHLTQLSPTTCPHYFRWIQEDLRPWKSQGISREDVERAKPLAHFRLVIVNGKAYLERFNNAYQTCSRRHLGPGLLRMYPGQVPDLELMFRCEDQPAIHESDVSGTNSSSPPVLFHYCGDEDSLGYKVKKQAIHIIIIAYFWTLLINVPPTVHYYVLGLWTFLSFVGCRAEVNIKPWKSLVSDIIEKNKKNKWEDRVPYAYWKGNPKDWEQEERNGYAHSKLEDQCTHRYKIYIEGVGWSVSEKYILACDSMALFVKPKFHDFFTRSLVPLRHYWPVRPESMCRDIKFAVEWGNRNPSDELRSETMACSREGVVRQFMLESVVESPSHQLPCSMPTYDNVDESLHAMSKRKKEIEKEIVKLEEEYYGSS
ncbi:hypothetical protein LINPERHAP1_LOCUS19992 [Linum perenne]